jgi:hypothetical protein
MYSRVSLSRLLAYSAAYRNALLISFFLSLFAYQIQAIGPFVAPLCFSSLVVDCGFGDDRGKKLAQNWVQFFVLGNNSVISSRGSSERGL